MPPWAGPAPVFDVPPEASPSFDDSGWELVDAPHDMLINQNYDPKFTKQMGYLPRNSVRRNLYPAPPFWLFLS